MTCDPLGLKMFHPFIIMCRILVTWLFVFFFNLMLVLFLIFISLVEPGLSCYLRSSVFLWDAGFLVAAYELLVVACRI